MLTRFCMVIGLVTACASGRGRPPVHYDDPKAMIGVFEDPARDAWQQPGRVLAALPLSDRAGMVADIGAGSGYFTRRLAQQVPEGRVYAVDVDGEFEDYLVDHRESWGTPNIEPHLAHYDDPMLPERALHLVFSANTYALIRDRVDYFSRVRKSLADDGALALLDFRPDARPPQGVAPAPKFRIDVEQAKRELAQAGFDVVEQPSFLSHQWFLVLRPRPSR